MNYSLLCFGAVEITFTVLAGVLLLFIFLFCLIVPMKYWLNALFSKAHIPSYKLISLKSRKLDINHLVEAYILSKKAKLGFNLEFLEAHLLAGGDCKKFVAAILKAKQAGVKLDVPLAQSIDLTTHNLDDVLNSAINSKVIQINAISAVTQDSIELIVSVSATVKVDLENYFKELGEEALKTKIHNFVISNIALSGNHKNSLSSPNVLISGWQKSRLDDNCSYKLLDLQIAKVELGRDVGAEMAEKRAGKEKAYAQMLAEKEKNQEVQRELEMKTRVEQMKSEVLAAEAEVPRAIADAIKEGRFSVMDYYKLMNLQADTALRRSIISSEKSKKEED